MHPEAGVQREHQDLERKDEDVKGCLGVIPRRVICRARRRPERADFEAVDGDTDERAGGEKEGFTLETARAKVFLEGRPWHGEGQRE